MTRRIALSLAVSIGVGAAATPAAAVVVPFATFSVLNTTSDFRFASNGNASNRTADGFFYSTATPGGPPGSVNVRFSFLEAPFVNNGYVQNVTANLTFFATVALNSPATPIGAPAGTRFSQNNLSGTFSFTTTSAITVTGPDFATHTYAAGSNLLSASFSGLDISGRIGGSSGSSSASTLGGDTVIYSSDFLNFSPTVARDLGLVLTAITPAFTERTGANKALNNFRASVSGQFSSDPAPLVNGLAIVPEPGSWGMLLVGFGLVGIQSRRRVQPMSVAA